MSNVLKGIKIGAVANRSGHNDHQTLRALAQSVCAMRLADFAALTDNSTGTAQSPVPVDSGSLAALADFTAIAASGTNLAPKAGVDTAIGKVNGALKTLQVRIHAMIDAAAASKCTYNGGGTDGAGTVAAMDKTFTAVNGSGSNAASAANLQAYLVAARNAMAAITVDLNRARVAAGFKPVRYASLGHTLTPTTVAALAANTGTGVDGANAGANAGVANTEANTVFTALANNVATLAAAVNEVAADGPVMAVTAVAN